jgi:DNA-directed RNA polymerase specialized sigma24 family protein
MIKVWEHDGTQVEETPCAACALTEDSRFTREYVPEASEVRSERVGGVDADEAVAAVLPVSVMAEAVRLLLSLPKDALEVVRLRYCWMPYAEIARLMGKSVDAVEKRHERVLEKNPVLWALFPRKVLKRRARRRKKGKGGPRPEDGGRRS